MEKQKGKEESKKTLENESQIEIIKLFLSMNRSKKISYVRHSLPQTWRKNSTKSVNNFSLWESTKHPFLHQEFKPEENSTFSKPEFMKMSWVPQSKGRSNIFKEEFLTHPFITPNWFLYVACKGPSYNTVLGYHDIKLKQKLFTVYYNQSEISVNERIWPKKVWPTIRK